MPTFPIPPWNLPSRRYPLEIQKPSTDIIRVSTFKRGEIDLEVFNSYPIPDIPNKSAKKHVSPWIPQEHVIFWRGSSPPLVLKTSKNCKTHESCTTDSICGIYGSISYGSIFACENPTVICSTGISPIHVFEISKGLPPSFLDSIHFQETYLPYLHVIFTYKSLNK